MKKRLLVGGAIVLFLVVILTLRLYFPESYVQELIVNAGPLAPVVYVLITLLIYILLPMLGAPMVYIGYYAFGRNVVFLVAIASFISFLTNFLIARKYGRKLVMGIVGKKALRQVDMLSKEHGLTMLFFLRVFQGGLNDIVSYASGLTNFKLFPYFWVSLLGLIPGTLFWYGISFIATDSVSFFVVSTVFSWVLSILFIGGTILVTRMKKNSTH